VVLFGEVLHELYRHVHLCVHCNALLVDLLVLYAKALAYFVHCNALLVDLLVLYAKALAYFALHGGPPVFLFRCVILMVEDVLSDLLRELL
jgi:hypothetical protein